MDTGLNNTNTLHLALGKDALKEVEWLIEATSAEQDQIWGMWNKRVSWQEISSGHLFTLMSITVEYKGVKETLPITLQFSYAIINGIKIAFYTSPSRLTHSGYLEAFLITHFQRTHHNYSRWNRVDAMNVHNCFGYLDTTDSEPRDTTYEPSDYNRKYHIFPPITLQQ